MTGDEFIEVTVYQTKCPFCGDKVYYPNKGEGVLAMKDHLNKECVTFTVLRNVGLVVEDV